MSGEIIKVKDEFYIQSTSARLDDRTRVLKHGDTFATFDRFGDIDTLGRAELGLYHEDTRYLSRLALRIGNAHPLLLSSSVKEDNSILTVDLTNLDAGSGQAVAVPRGTIHIFRSAILRDATCSSRLRLHNFGLAPVEFSLHLEFAADFTDLFEVRGMQRPRRGRLAPPEGGGGELLFCYEGLDGRVRRTRVAFDPAPDHLEPGHARYDVRLAPGADVTIEFSARCEASGSPVAAPVLGFEEACARTAGALREAAAGEPVVVTSNEQFNDWFNRSVADLHMMLTDTPHGAYPYAGVPWYSTAFGRDGIITALECVWFNPAVARGVLSFLASMQAETEDAERDAQPGKILHETRSCEMAALGEVPFGRYYGSVDSTPLFIVLAGAYYERTGDAGFTRAMWPHVDRALAWIDEYGDLDGDGFVEYARRSEHGLANQGWKDSHDAVFHDDGSPAEGPIALCEVQGYVYAAQRAAATLARCLGDPARADDLEDRAERLRRRFEEAFWCEELSTYVLALDGDKRPCRIRTSNAGHCLYGGIASEERARVVAATLTSQASFSGWGVRTVASGEACYNPMSYHNGSVWPHDNAMIAAGFARYGRKAEVARILGGLLDSSLFFELHRLPELFCGFHRRPGEAPTLYPVSCSPQTWASGAVLMLLQACLGLQVRAPERQVVFTNPCLPQFLSEVRISGLRVGDASLDLSLVRHEGEAVGVNVVRRHGHVDVVSLK